MRWEERTINMKDKLITAMVQCRTPDECVERINLSVDAGAEALGIQLCKLEHHLRTEDDLRKIFSACGDREIYVTSYRGGLNKGFTDDECVDLLLKAGKCGGTLLDVMGDVYCPSQYELATDKDAVSKQIALIDKIHSMGCKVLMSSHTNSVLSAEKTLEIALCQQERGADIIKIVNQTQSMSDLCECIRTIQLLKEKLDKPFLYLVGGPCQDFIRQTGVNLGVCMYLTTYMHGELDTKAQPITKNIRAIRDNMLF